MKSDRRIKRHIFNAAAKRKQRITVLSSHVSAIGVFGQSVAVERRRGEGCFHLRKPIIRQSEFESAKELTPPRIPMYASADPDVSVHFRIRIRRRMQNLFIKNKNGTWIFLQAPFLSDVGRDSRTRTYDLLHVKQAL